MLVICKNKRKRVLSGCNKKKTKDMWYAFKFCLNFQKYAEKSCQNYNERCTFLEIPLLV